MCMCVINWPYVFPPCIGLSLILYKNEMKYWYSYKIFILKKTNRLDFNTMRQLGIPKKIIGKVILNEVINDFRLKKNLSNHNFKYN